MNIPQLSILLVAFCSSSFASYTVNGKVEPAEGGYRYTWTVHNQDQSQGLVVFVIEVPVQARVLAWSVPPPYSNPEGSRAQWVFHESYEAQVDPNDNQAWLSAPPAGKKWLRWAGQQPPSVYPSGTTVTFSLTTDSAIKPGVVRGVTTTYTPENTPHYYAPFHGNILGPSGATFEPNALPSAIFTNVQFKRATSPDLSATHSSNQANPGPVSTSLDLYPGVTIEGEIGRTYGIQYSTDVDTAAWRGLINVTLSSTKQIWFDSQSASESRRFYRVVPGPISIP